MNLKKSKFTIGKLVLLAMLLSVLTYASSLGGVFINYDDSGFIGGNPYLEGPLDEFISFAFTSFTLTIWHPVTWLSYWLNHAIWDGDIFGYRIVNLFLHMFNSALVTLLAWRFCALMGLRDNRERLLAASVVGIGFAVHPLHVEPVVWIASRKDVLYAFFWMLSVYFYLDHAQGRGRWRYGLSLLMFALSIMSKPMAMTLPAVLLLLDYYPLGRLKRGSLKPVLLEKVPFFALTIFTGYMAVWAQASGKGFPGFMVLGPLGRLWVSVRALSVYVIDAFLPFTRIPAKSAITSVDLLGFEYIGAFVLLFTLVGAAFYNIRRRPVIFFSLAFYVITVSPVIGLLNFSKHGTADRFMYMPLVGLLTIAAAAVIWLVRCMPARSREVKALLIVVAMLFTLVSSNYSQVWTEPVKFWSYAHKMNPGDYETFSVYGSALYMDGRYHDAVRVLDDVLQNKPDDVITIHFIVKSLNELARYDEVLELAQRGIDLSLERDDEDNNKLIRDFYDIRGKIYISQKRFNDALVEYDAMIGYLPEASDAYAWRGIVRDKLGDSPGARDDFVRSIELDPSKPMPFYFLFTQALKNGELELAERAINGVIELQPEPEVYCERAELYEKMGNNIRAGQDRLKCNQ